MRIILNLLLTFALISGGASAGDLYKVLVENDADALALRQAGAEPVIRLNDGYLVIAAHDVAEQMTSSGLSVTLVATNMDRSQLGLDNRLDRLNTANFPLIYEEGDLRIYRIEPSPEPPAQIAPILTEKIDIDFQTSGSVDISRLQAEISLDSLIGLVSQDSLFSYTSRLQAFYRRYIGTDSNRAAANWIMGKFQEFGYDSVVLDSFYISSYSVWAHNVLCYKIGATDPLHQIIIGAHRDAVSNSPGADDNGSGTAGVIEMARVLANLDTKMTFIFALFDAEEQGLLGSWNYANAAKARGDSIVYMFNMDMIAHFNNSTQAKLYHGPVTTYTVLWQSLADSLAGITGVLSGSSGGSDHYPFIQNGYQATFAHEYNFSTVYHSPRDSTNYMNFEYMTRMVKASLATVYTVNNIYAPVGAVMFSYPLGVPSIIPPNQPATFEVVATGTYGTEPLPGSGRLHYSLNQGAFIDVAMVELSPNHYQAAIPAQDCFTKIDFYVEARDTENNIYLDPDPVEPNHAVVAEASLTIFEDNFQTHKGWTVSGTASAGHWQRGIPLGDGVRGDPTADFDGSGFCYLTGNASGDSDIDNGNTQLTSPSFNLSGVNDALISYARWYSNNAGNDPFNDVMIIYISNDNGANWTVAETVGPSVQASGGWYTHSFWASNFVSPTANMRIRFEASDYGLGSVVEAGIDAVSILTFECASFVCGDANGSGAVNILDATFIINYLYKSGAAPSPLEAADANGNGSINILDATYILTHLYKSGPEPICP
ncbi:MAG: M28 family peptidase [Candidatus Zixiibacteriota bacterium]